MPIPRLEQGQLVVASTDESPLVSISTARFILVVTALILTVATLYTAYQLLRGTDWKLIVDFLRYGLIISVAIGCLVFSDHAVPYLRAVYNSGGDPYSNS
ncbi:MAG: hypothetical protein QM730_22625 [Anaerolineales bacterium]